MSCRAEGSRGEWTRRAHRVGREPNEVFDADGRLLLSDAHAPLFAWIGAGFVPLMQQNRAAFERERAGGGRLFNEAAFDAGRALYDGVLCGQPFRSVAKSFQVRVWRDLVRAWRALPAEARVRVAALLPREVSLDDGVGE